MKWFIDYLDSEGNWNTLPIDAHDKTEAEKKALEKYFDIDTILNIHK